MPRGTATQSLTSRWFWTASEILSINSRFFGCVCCVFLKLVVWIFEIFIMLILKHVKKIFVMCGMWKNVNFSTNSIGKKISL